MGGARKGEKQRPGRGAPALRVCAARSERACTWGRLLSRASAKLSRSVATSAASQPWKRLRGVDATHVT
jgi:hypothetical protein